MTISKGHLKISVLSSGQGDDNEEKKQSKKNRKNHSVEPCGCYTSERDNRRRNPIRSDCDRYER